MRESSKRDIEETVAANAPTKGTFAREVFLRRGLRVLSRCRLSNWDEFPLRL
jgi:hypothetical protein